MPKGKLYIEKREFKRFEKKYDVHYSKVAKEFTSETELLEGKSVDISTGGIRIEGEIPGVKGEIIRLEIIRGIQRPVIVFAEIKWHKENQFGVSFLALKADDKELIEKLIE